MFGVDYVHYGFMPHVPINTKFRGTQDARCKRRKFKKFWYTDVRMKFRKNTSQSWEVLVGRDYKCVAGDQKGKSLPPFQAASGKRKENNVLTWQLNQFPLENKINRLFLIRTAFSVMSFTAYA